MTTSPEELRRRVLRQACYALNTRALYDDTVPPEGPFDVALTNALLVIVHARDPLMTVNERGYTKSARELLGCAEQLGISMDYDTLKDGLEVTQPKRHGREDDEWVALQPRHVVALVELDELQELQVLDEAQAHPRFGDLVYALFEKHSREIAGFGTVDPKEAVLLIEPEYCDECGRPSFIPKGLDESGGTLRAGNCLACGHERSEETAYDLYIESEMQRWTAY